MILSASKLHVLRKALLILGASAIATAVVASIGTTRAEASASAPSAPTNVNVTAGNTDATLTWTAASGNGSPVSSYVITPYEGAMAEPATTVACSATPAPCTGPAIQATVFGLTNETSYTFTVAATNASGSGPASSQTSPVTPHVAIGTWSATNTIANLSGPYGVAVDHNTGTLYVSNNSTDTVSVIDASTGAVVANVHVGGGAQGLAVDPTTDKVYVADNSSNAVSYFNATNCNASHTAGCPLTASTITVGNGPWDLSVDPSTGTVYVANNFGNSVSVISEATESVVATVSVIQGANSRPEMAAVDPATDQVYVANYRGGGVSVIDGATCNASTQANCTATLPSGLSTISDGPATVAVDPATGLVYVPNAPGGVSSSSTLNNNTVSVLDGSTGTTLKDISSSAFSFSDYEEAAVLQSNDMVGVTNSNSDTVSIVNGATATVSSSVTVGACPIGIAADQTAGLFYVANYCINSVSVLSSSPADPTSVTATPSDGSATVSFTTPVSDGGSAISSYLVTPYAGNVAQTPETFTCGSASGDIDCSSAATDGISAAVTGLTDGVTYRFAVAAVNTAQSTGQLSSPSGEVVPGLPPSSPTGVVASSAGQSSAATVSWTAPSSDGGVAVASYSVTPYLYGATAGTATSFTCGSAPGDLDCASAATDGITAQVTGLANGSSYSFVVKATNAVGSSSASGASGEVKVGVPGAPQLTATASTIVILSWSPPLAPGGSALEGYYIFEATSPGLTATATLVDGPLVPTSSTSYDVKGLTAGTTYYFTAVAVNSFGSSPPSNEVTAVPALPPPSTTTTTTVSSTATTTPTVPSPPTTTERPLAFFAPPSAPQSVTASQGPTDTPGVGQADVSWAPPTSIGSAAITSYVVAPSGACNRTSRCGATTVGANALSTVVTGLIPGRPYTFSVVAESGAGASPASLPSPAMSVTTLEGAPGRPKAEPTPSGRVEVAFSTPSLATGLALQGYRVIPNPPLP